MRCHKAILADQVAALSHGGPAHSPTELHKHLLDRRGAPFQRGRQEDAHEFLRAVLDSDSTAQTTAIIEAQGRRASADHIRALQAGEVGQW